jgi:hypothetical protein
MADEPNCEIRGEGVEYLAKVAAELLRQEFVFTAQYDGDTDLWEIILLGVD